MYIYDLQRRLSIASLLVLLSSPIAAQEVGQPGWIETREQWGQLIFCQRIYKLPEVKSRLYDFDVESCNRANQMLVDRVSKYSSKGQVELKNQAERHAALLSLNTSEPYLSVPACREICGELAESPEEPNDR
jgi:hypothetical protein